MAEAHCYWSHKLTDKTDLKRVAVNGSEVLVLPKYEQKLKRFSSFVQSYSRLALGLVLFAFALIVVAAFTRVSWLSDAALVLLGVTLTIFPFATSTTYDLAGVRAATLVVRIAGVVFTVFGLVLLIF